MSERNLELVSFLQRCRRRLTPAQVGLQPSKRRRIKHLRREDVASIADVGITWYTWLEQGRSINIADGTLERIASALRLNPSELEYLHNLVHSSSSRTELWEGTVSPCIRNLVEGYTLGYALILNPRWDILAHNANFAALFGLVGARPLHNLITVMFTVPRARRVFPDWWASARQLVAMFRVDYASYVGSARFCDFIGELARDSTDFSSIWSESAVLSPMSWVLGKTTDSNSGVMRSYETVSLPVPATPGQRIIFHFPKVA